MSILDEINRGSASIEEQLEAGVDSLLEGNRSSQANAAKVPGGTECQPNRIYSVVNQIGGGGLLSATEGTVFLNLFNPVLTGGPGSAPVALAIAAGSAINLQPVQVPKDFYLAVTGCMMRVDEEPNTVDVAGSITAQGQNENPATDLWLPTAAAGSPNPKGLVWIGSNIGFVVSIGKYGLLPVVPGGFQINFQFFRNALSVNPCNVEVVLMGILLLDRNYEIYRTAT